MFCSRTVVALTALALSVRAVDYSVPSTWRSPDSSRSRAERNTIAQNGINYIKQWLDTSSYEYSGLGYWPTANVVSSIAFKDLVNGATDNKAYVTNIINNIYSKYAAFYKYEYNDDALWWGTAAMYAYQAYGDPTLRDKAVANWNKVTNYVITAAQAASNSHPTRNFAIKGTCNSKTTAGGVFWTTTSSDGSVNVITTSLYLTLSAYLAESTKDSKYTTAAQNAAAFIAAQRFDSTKQIALDTLNLKDCTTTDWVFTYNNGKYIEGLMVLADVTGNSAYRNTALNVIGAAAHLSNWQGSDGIITEGQDNPTTNNDGRGFKAIYIRSLTVAYRRNASNTQLRTLLSKYITVQFNALYDLARNGDSYGVVWHGPYVGPYSWGQLAALDVLNGHLQLSV